MPASLAYMSQKSGRTLFQKRFAACKSDTDIEIILQAENLINNLENLLCAYFSLKLLTHGITVFACQIASLCDMPVYCEPWF